MKIEYIEQYVLLTHPSVQLHPLCMERLAQSMQLFNLHSACPLVPALHRAHGIFECNRVITFRLPGVQLHPYCLIITISLWPYLQGFDFAAPGFVPHYAQYILLNKLKHGLVCNALAWK